MWLKVVRRTSFGVEGIIVINYFMTEVPFPVHWFLYDRIQYWFLYDRNLCHERINVSCLLLTCGCWHVLLTCVGCYIIAAIREKTIYLHEKALWIGCGSKFFSFQELLEKVTPSLKPVVFLCKCSLNFIIKVYPKFYLVFEFKNKFALISANGFALGISISTCSMKSVLCTY